MQGHWFDPWSEKIPNAMEQLSPHATPTEAHAPRARALQQEKPPQREACAQLREASPIAALEKAHARRLNTARKKQINKIKIF